MTLDEVSAGYGSQVVAVFEGKNGAGVRREIQIFTKERPILDMSRKIDRQMADGQQMEDLGALAKVLAPYKIFEDVSEDAGERAAFVLALVKREKSLQ